MSAVYSERDHCPRFPSLKSPFIVSLLSGFLLFIFSSLPALAGQVTLAWDPNTEPDLAGYKLYYGTSPNNYSISTALGIVNTYTVDNLNAGVTYYFALTAFDSEGFESGFSNEVSYTVPVTQYTLTATSGSGGSVTPAGVTTVNSGESRTYAIAPNSGYQIASVTVDGISQGAVGSYTFNNVTANHTIAATFTAIPTYTLTVGQTGSGGGTVTTNPSGTTFPTGTVVTLTAAANASSTFSGWSGACSGTTNHCTVTMNANKSVTAGFTLKTYTLNVGQTGTGTGTVTSNPAGSTFNYGTVVTLTATPGVLSTFTGWSGACVGNTNPCTVTMTAQVSVTAAFSLETEKPISLITSPVSGSIIRKNSYTITGTATDGSGSGIQRVEVSTDGGATWQPANGTSSWSHSWTIPKSGTYSVKSRATDHYGNVENPGSGVTITAALYQPTPVKVSGKQLLVNGAPFIVKGVVYSPTPIGDDPNRTPYGDYFTETYNPLAQRDFPMLRSLGANTLRLYHWEKSADHFAFLDQAYNGAVEPVYVIAGYWINEGLDIDPASPANVREQIKAGFREMVAAHKDHPAILMWSIGHNLNQAEAYGNNLPALFSLINEMAEAAHLEEGAQAHPVTTALADEKLAATVSGFEGSVPALDVWGANVNRGNSFGSLFAELDQASQKPLLITEYGADAFDNNRGEEYEKTGAPVQADTVEALWKEIAANGQTCLGGTVLSYSDEWWRGQYGLDPGCLDSDPAIQGRCGTPTAAQPDGYANEEWWGLVRIRDNGAGPDSVEPRAVYYRLQLIWGTDVKSLTVVTPNGGEVWQAGRSQSITWNFQGNLGSTVQIQVLENGKLVYTITKKAPVGTNGLGTYTWTPPWKLKPGGSYQVRVVSNNEPMVQDASDGSFTMSRIRFVQK